MDHERYNLRHAEPENGSLAWRVSITLIALGTMLALFSLGSCTSTMDSAQERVDQSVERATVQLKAASSEIIKDALTQAESRATALPKQLIDSTKAALSGEIASLKKQIEGLQEKLVNAVPPEDRERFKQDIKEKGFFPAIKDWAVEIILGLLGLSGTAWGRGMIQKRRAQRAEEDAELKGNAMKVFVTGIERTNGGSEQVKAEIAKCLKEEHPDIEYEVRKLVSRAKSQMGKPK